MKKLLSILAISTFSSLGAINTISCNSAIQSKKANFPLQNKGLNLSLKVGDEIVNDLSSEIAHYLQSNPTFKSINAQAIANDSNLKISITSNGKQVQDSAKAVNQTTYNISFSINQNDQYFNALKSPITYQLTASSTYNHLLSIKDFEFNQIIPSQPAIKGKTKVVKKTFTIAMTSEDFAFLLRAMRDNNNDPSQDNIHIVGTQDRFEFLFQRFGYKTGKNSVYFDNYFWHQLYEQLVYKKQQIASVAYGYVGVLTVDWDWEINPKHIPPYELDLHPTLVYSNTASVNGSNFKTNLKTDYDPSKEKPWQCNLPTSALPTSVGSKNQDVNLLLNKDMLNYLINQKVTSVTNVDQILNANQFQYSNNDKNEVDSGIYNLLTNAKYQKYISQLLNGTSQTLFIQFHNQMPIINN